MVTSMEMPKPPLDGGSSTRGVSLKSSPAARPPSRAVLVVDDERDIVESLGMVLGLDGTPVFTASSGREALDLMKRQTFGVVLTDYKMPEMDGFQFIAEARKIDPGIQVLMMTAYPDPGLAARAKREFGVGLVLPKPFDTKYVIGVVQAALAGKPLAPPPKKIR